MIVGRLLDRISARIGAELERIAQRFAAELGVHVHDVVNEWMPAILFLMAVAFILWIFSEDR